MTVKAMKAKGYEPLVQNLYKWLEEISNNFVELETRGFIEGLNNKTKLIKRRFFGILSKEQPYRPL